MSLKGNEIKKYLGLFFKGFASAVNFEYEKLKKHITKSGKNIISLSRKEIDEVTQVKKKNQLPLNITPKEKLDRLYDNKVLRENFYRLALRSISGEVINDAGSAKEYQPVLRKKYEKRMLTKKSIPSSHITKKINKKPNEIVSQTSTEVDASQIASAKPSASRGTTTRTPRRRRVPVPPAPTKTPSRGGY